MQHQNGIFEQIAFDRGHLIGQSVHIVRFETHTFLTRALTPAKRDASAKLAKSWEDVAEVGPQSDKIAN